MLLVSADTHPTGMSMLVLPSLLLLGLPPFGVSCEGMQARHWLILSSGARLQEWRLEDSGWQIANLWTMAAAHKQIGSRANHRMMRRIGKGSGGADGDGGCGVQGERGDGAGADRWVGGVMRVKRREVRVVGWALRLAKRGVKAERLMLSLREGPLAISRGSFGLGGSGVAISHWWWRGSSDSRRHGRGCLSGRGDSVGFIHVVGMIVFIVAVVFIVVGVAFEIV